MPQSQESNGGIFSPVYCCELLGAGSVRVSVLWTLRKGVKGGLWEGEKDECERMAVREGGRKCECMGVGDRARAQESECVRGTEEQPYMWECA